MVDFILAILAAFWVFFASRLETSLEVLALHQQLAVFKRKRPRPSINRFDRFFRTILRALWPRWSDVLLIAKPDGDRMAPGRLSPVLALAIPAPAAVVPE